MNARALIAGGAALALLAGFAAAQSGGQFVVDKSVIAGGSADSAGGAFHASATVGQHDAGVMSGGNFGVRGGYWPAGCSAADTIYRNGFDPAAC